VDYFYSSFDPDENNIYEKFTYNYIFTDLSPDYYYCIRFRNVSPISSESSDEEDYSIFGDFTITD